MIACSRCERAATVEAGGSYYCAEHGGFEQVFARHGLVNVRSLARADSAADTRRPGTGEAETRRREAAGE